MKVSSAVFLFLLGSSLALAADYTISPSFLGSGNGDWTNLTIQVNGQLGSATQGGGGEFSGTVTHGAPTGTPPTVAFWCIDDQEAFSWGETRTGNITLLGDVTADATHVHYGNVTDSSTPKWTDQTGALSGAAYSTAQSRFTLAAYLVSQYPGFSDGIFPTSGDPGRADAIQQAIWTITNTTGGFPGEYCCGTNNPNGTFGSLTTDSVAYWIQQALSNATNPNSPNKVDPTTWAVVSWSAVDGVLGTEGYGGDKSANQTFLVQLSSSVPITGGTIAPTPEPGFYGILAAGLGGLFLVARRKIIAKTRI